MDSASTAARTHTSSFFIFILSFLFLSIYYNASGASFQYFFLFLLLKIIKQNKSSLRKDSRYRTIKRKQRKLSVKRESSDHITRGPSYGAAWINVRRIKPGDQKNGASREMWDRGKQGFGDVILVARRLAPLIEAEQLSKRKEIGTALQRRKAPCYDYIQLDKSPICRFD